jgi:hypothetical protein
MEIISAGDALGSLKSDIDDFWVILSDDTSLSPDKRADITKVMEEAEESISAARKIARKSSEDE